MAANLLFLLNRKGREMNMIDPKGFAIAARDGKYKPSGDRLPVDRMLYDAIVDVEDGVEFWKTLRGNRYAKGGHSSEFLNRNG
jgi:hypothetical protein